MVGLVRSANYHFQSTISGVSPYAEALTNGLFAMPLKVDGLTKIAKLTSVVSRVLFVLVTANPVIGAAVKTSGELAELLGKHDLFKRLSQLREISEAHWTGKIGLIGIVAVRALDWVKFLATLGLYSLSPLLNFLGQYYVWNLLVINCPINLLQLTALSCDTIANLIKIHEIRNAPQSVTRKVEACTRIQRLWQAHLDVILKNKAGLVPDPLPANYAPRSRQDIADLNYFNSLPNRVLIIQDILPNEFTTVTDAFQHRVTLTSPAYNNNMKVEIEGRIRFWEARKLTYGKELNKAQATVVANVAKLVGIIIIGWAIPWALPFAGLAQYAPLFLNKDSIVRLASDGVIVLTDWYKTLIGDIQMSKVGIGDRTIQDLTLLTDAYLADVNYALPAG